ncbi:MAG: hypothetical protein HYZ29_33435 [Myxococcales bacterium]|nr:hypothetical protein [Myxococcales bacterium]
MGWLGRIAPIALVWCVACAHVDETRVRSVIDEESLRLSETPRPDLARARVSARLSGPELELTVRSEPRCLVQFAERVRVRERVRRTPSAAALGAEAALMALGLAAGIGLRRGSSDGEVGARDVLGVVALSGGLGAGVALGIDASRWSDTEIESTETVPDDEPRVAPCKVPVALAVRAVLVNRAGRALVVPLDGLGRGRARVPDDFWEQAQLDLDVKVDGVVVQRLVLERSP